MTREFVRMANWYLMKGTFPMYSMVIQGDKVQTWTLGSMRECLAVVELCLGCELKTWGRLALEAFASVNVGGYTVKIERVFV